MVTESTTSCAKIPKPFTKIWKMMKSLHKKLKFKSADEKLRGISKQPLGTKPPDAPKPPPHEMAERRIQQRQGRRDNFRANDSSKGQQEQIDIKRRSRSEGPSGRVRQRDSNRIHQTDSFAKGDNVLRPTWNVEEVSTATRVSRHSPPISDDNGFANFIFDAGSDSDSYDSDKKVWKKNPILTRKSRRSGANSERRRSNLDNGGGGHVSTRDSFVYYSTSGPHDKSDSSTGSFKGTNKYQKLEELRKKRLDIQMTSDEENTPESRISRLRQRAIQGGLGRQPLNETQPSNNVPSYAKSHVPPSNVPGAFPTSNTPNPKNYQPNARNSAVYSNNSTQNHSASSQYMPNVPRNSQGNYVPASPTNYKQNVPQRNYQQSRANRPQNTEPNSDPVPFGSPQTARVITYGRMINNEQSFAKPYTGVLSDSGPTTRNSQSQKQHYAFSKNSRTTSVDNPNYSPVKNNRFVYSSSPEVGRKFDLNQARGSSIDSVYDSGVAQPDMTSARAKILRRINQHGHPNAGFQTGISENGHKPVYVNPPTNQTMEVQRGSVVRYPVPSHRSSRIHEPVELRFDTNRPHVYSPDRDYRYLNRAHSEDSLDEIVMSNVQYLESQPGRGKALKAEVPVSRSASLPDPKRYGMTQSRSAFPSGQPLQKTVVQSVPYRHTVEKSEYEIRVPIHGNSRRPPEIKIAEENRMDTFDFNGNVLNFSSAGFAVPRQERKMSYDSHTGHSRPTSQYYDRDDISKSDSQLNTATVMPQNYKGDLLHPYNYNQPKSVSADHLLPSGMMGVVHSQDEDTGMFSDVEYEIEVSDRIKKWENKMKKTNEPTKGNGLTTIQEKTEDYGLTPYDPRRAPQQDIPRPITVSSNYAWSAVDPRKSSSSDPTVHLVGDPQILTHESNTHRYFQLMPGGRVQTTSNSMSTLYQAQPIQKDMEQRSMPMLNYPNTQPQKLITAGQLREKIIIDRESSLDDSSLDSPSISDRGSKFMRYQELQDIKGSKDESVSSLCKMFNFNEDSEGRQIAKVSPHKQSNDDEWAKIISDMEDNIKKADVWSPHMESTKGESLSIERVKARTLQTIAFSDDPFWKEIEEMTSFESLVGQKSGDSKHSSLDDQYLGREGSQSQSSTLPNQPRLTTSSKDRLQRSKSLYTPNIAPLTLGMPPRSHNSQNTLEDALEDLKSSVDRSSTMESFDSKSSSQSQSLKDFKVSAPVRSSMYIENVNTKDQPRKSSWQHRSSGVYDIPDNISAKDLYTFAAEPGQAFVNVVNGNYALDPNLLKSKLLSTGLVEDRDDPFYTDNRGQNNRERNNREQNGGPGPTRYQEVVTSSTKPVAMAAPQRQFQSEDKRNQVSESMEDLRQLAKNVENKIELIKSKLVQADDTNLDKILVALRKFAPTAGPRSPEIRSETMHDFYQSKHSKLSDALTELERIYKNLDLDNESLFDRAERRDYPSYRKPSPEQANNICPQKRETTSLSINISPPAYYDKTDVEKQTQSEFDAISKSFQAILDEVNQTSGVTTSSEDVWISGPQSTPDSPRLPMKVTLKSTQIPTPTSRSPIPSVSTVSDSDQSRLRKSRQRFRKVPDIVGDDVAVRKARSKSSPRIETVSIVSPSPTTADYLNPREISAAKGRIRIRPEREPDVMHDDMAYRNLSSKQGQETTNIAKSSIQIELSSPEYSPQILPEKVFQLKLTRDAASAPLVFHATSPTESPLVFQPTSPIESSPQQIMPEPKHEPKIMGGMTSTITQPSLIKSLQLGKVSSLPTKIQPKEIVTAVIKEPAPTVEDVKTKDTDQVKSVAMFKVPAEVPVKKVQPQLQLIIPNPKVKDVPAETSVVLDPSKKLPKLESSKIQIAAKQSKPQPQNTQVSGKSNPDSSKMRAVVKPSGPEIQMSKLSDKQAAQPTTKSETATITKTVTAKVQPSKPAALRVRKTEPAVVTKAVVAKTQPPKLATTKLAKFNKPEPVVTTPKDTKLAPKPGSKAPAAKVAPTKKMVKTELKLATANKAVKPVMAKSEAETPLKLPEKEFIIKLPATAVTKPKPESLPVPEKRTVETQTTQIVPPKDSKSNSKQNATERRKLKRGASSRVDLFSSSDEDRRHQMRPLLTRSAPDLSLLSLDDDEDIDADLIDDPTSKGTQAEITEDNTDLDESDAVFLDASDSAPLSPVSSLNNTKPPAGPSSKSINPSECAKILSGQLETMMSDNRVNNVCSDIDKGVMLRRRHSLERTVIDNSDQSERPQSFHELLASFETNEKRLVKLRSLRKCLSEDNMTTETFVAKVYRSNDCLSEPDLSENSSKAPTKAEVKSWKKYS